MFHFNLHQITLILNGYNLSNIFLSLQVVVTEIHFLMWNCPVQCKQNVFCKADFIGLMAFNPDFFPPRDHVSSYFYGLKRTHRHLWTWWNSETSWILWSFSRQPGLFLLLGACSLGSGVCHRNFVTSSAGRSGKFCSRQVGLSQMCSLLDEKSDHVFFFYS